MSFDFTVKVQFYITYIDGGNKLAMEDICARVFFFAF